MEKLLNWLDNPNVLATVKTFTYRIFSSATTFVMMYWLTDGNVKESGQATLLFMITKPLLFWIHERVWLSWENKRNNQKEKE